MRFPNPLILFLLTSPYLAAQTPPTPAVRALPRTEFGHPDFQGNWSNRTQTPISRPGELGEQRTYTEQQALAMEASARNDNQTKFQALDPDREAPEEGSSIRQEADQNFTDIRIDVLKVKGEYRTSMIVDPADGQFPFLDGGRQKDIFAQWRAEGHDAADGPEIRSAAERCLSRGVPPMVVPPYNANYQIVQTRDYLMLFGEMVHDARIIRLDGEHQGGALKTWLGDSIGHWEGDTLVVHSVNFRPEISHFRLTSSDQMELTERFTLHNDKEIFYSFTVTDPQIYSQPFTEELTLKRREPGEHLYEYACHEGNYSFAGILAGARRLEADAQKQAPAYPEN
ncbi:MAG: hypothetical protein HQ498_02880 [Pseudohongiella sp.]|jgi:hypothetical protein|nr:hypothetical protein [Pseudohongiella sp.]